MGDMADALTALTERLDRLEAERGTEEGSASGASLSALKVKGVKPDVFSGKADPEDWLFTLRLYLDANGIVEDVEKIQVLGLLIREDARAWYRTYVSRIEIAGGVLPGYAEVTAALLKNFMLGDKALTARRKLQDMEVENITTRAYVEKFRSIIVNLPNAHDSELQAAFYKGLKETVRVQVELHSPGTITNAMDLAIRAGDVVEVKSRRKGVHLVTTEEDDHMVSPQVNALSRKGGDLTYPLVIKSRGGLLTVIEKALRNPWVRSKVVGHLQHAHPESLQRGDREPLKDQGRGRKTEVNVMQETEATQYAAYDSEDDEVIDISMISAVKGVKGDTDKTAGVLDPDSLEEEEQVACEGYSKRPQMHVSALIGGKASSLFVDVGASANVMFLHTAQRLGLAIKQQTKVLMGFGQNQVHTIGATAEEVKVGRASAPLRFEVVEGRGKTILGKVSIGKLGLTICPRTDRLLHDASGTMIPCFMLNTPQKKRSKGCSHVTYSTGQGESGERKQQGGSFPVHVGEEMLLFPGEERSMHTAACVTIPVGMAVVFEPESRGGVAVMANIYAGRCADRSVQVVIRNLNRQKARIRTGARLGFLHPIRIQAGESQQPNLAQVAGVENPKNGNNPGVTQEPTGSLMEVL